MSKTGEARSWRLLVGFADDTKNPGEMSWLQARQLRGTLKTPALKNKTTRWGVLWSRFKGRRKYTLHTKIPFQIHFVALQNKTEKNGNDITHVWWEDSSLELQMSLIRNSNCNTCVIKMSWYKYANINKTIRNPQTIVCHLLLLNTQVSATVFCTADQFWTVAVQCFRGKKERKWKSSGGT